MILPTEAGGILTINLSALAANYKMLSARCSHDQLASYAQCAAVVKANAYGLGIEAVVPALLNVGCTTFFVAALSEGKRVREIAPQAVIYVLNGLLAGTAPVYAAHNLRPVLGSEQEIAEWEAYGFNGAAALHVDTGMNRLGLGVEEAILLHKNGAMQNINFSLLMSHFVSSEETMNPLNLHQFNQLLKVQNQIQINDLSISNSSGFYLELNQSMNLYRAGYALYGGNPTPGFLNPMRAVVRLEAPIVMLRGVKKGESVGYNAQWVAQKPSRIAVIGVGYADGLSRQLSASDIKKGGYAYVAGTLCPFAGRVSMDLITIDVSDVLYDIKRGDKVELLGEHISVDDMAGWANTNGYEVLTSLGHRYQRNYTKGV